MMLVPDTNQPEARVACYQTAAGDLGALDMPAFVAWRAGLPAHEAAGLHVIYIPPRMGFGRKAAVQDALMRISVAGGGREALALWGAQQRALLQCNVLAWEGPGFGGAAPSNETIDRLDPDEPLVGFVLAEIARRNPPRRSPDPKSHTASGSPAAGAAPSTASTAAPSGTSTSTSDSPSASGGPPGSSTPATPATSTSLSPA